MHCNLDESRGTCTIMGWVNWCDTPLADTIYRALSPGTQSFGSCERGPLGGLWLCEDLSGRSQNIPLVAPNRGVYSSGGSCESRHSPLFTHTSSHDQGLREGSILSRLEVLAMFPAVHRVRSSQTEEGPHKRRTRASRPLLHGAQSDTYFNLAPSVHPALASCVLQCGCQPRSAALASPSGPDMIVANYKTKVLYKWVVVLRKRVWVCGAGSSQTPGLSISIGLGPPKICY